MDKQAECVSLLKQYADEQVFETLPLETVARIFKHCPTDRLAETVPAVVNFCRWASGLWLIDAQDGLLLKYCYHHMQEFPVYSRMREEEQKDIAHLLSAVRSILTQKTDKYTAYELLKDFPLLTLHARGILSYANSASFHNEAWQWFCRSLSFENYVLNSTIWLWDDHLEGRVEPEFQQEIERLRFCESEIQDVMLYSWQPPVRYPFTFAPHTVALFWAKQNETDVDCFDIYKLHYPKEECLNRMMQAVLKANPQITFTYIPNNEAEKQLFLNLGFEPSETEQLVYNEKKTFRFTDPFWATEQSYRPYSLAFSFYADKSETLSVPFQNTSYTLRYEAVKQGALQNIVYITLGDAQEQALDVNVNAVLYTKDCPVLFYQKAGDDALICYKIKTGTRTCVPLKKTPYHTGTFYPDAFSQKAHVHVGYCYKTQDGYGFVPVYRTCRVGNVLAPHPKQDDNKAICKVAYNIVRNETVLYEFTDKTSACKESCLALFEQDADYIPTVCVTSLQYYAKDELTKDCIEKAKQKHSALEDNYALEVDYTPSETELPWMELNTIYASRGLLATFSYGELLALCEGKSVAEQTNLLLSLAEICFSLTMRGVRPQQCHTLLQKSCLQSPEAVQGLCRKDVGQFLSKWIELLYKQMDTQDEFLRIVFRNIKRLCAVDDIDLLKPDMAYGKDRMLADRAAILAWGIIFGDTYF